ncbi:MAG: carbamoyl phosphate synthase [Acidobacteria bacterium]|nr:MAG: carbamoyl phosphate synthase [Acidobacteriota bacterium]
MFKKVLVANRGEIAIRIIRAIHEAGATAVAVYSDFDRNALHVQMADEAYYAGGSLPAESYLNVEKILAIGRESGAEAVHPGYGFLAENSGFARAVVDSGMTWVGPSPDAIEAMGDKIASRRAAESAGFGPVPGTTDEVTNAAEVIAFGDEHGWPVAIKATAGGGGKGMRVVTSADEVEDALAGARREAESYFANPAVYLERYLTDPRHVEVQILCDMHGHAVYVGERDCSSQRRHQKLIEEAPCPSISPETRAALGEAAVSVARACGYINAGTVECLVDRDESFYFLEMNTRLQVEHCVTEMVTGLDLAVEQLRIAAGEPLSFGQEDIVVRGHSIECRINAEDPASNFMPSPGVITKWRPAGGPGVRVDAGYETGSEVPQYYDNLMAKLVVLGRDREEARRRMLRALDEFVVEGVATNIPAHKLILESPEFIDARHSTKFVEESLDVTELPAYRGGVGAAIEGQEPRDLVVELGEKRFEVKVWVPEGTLGAGGGIAAKRGATPIPTTAPKRSAASTGAGGASSAGPGTVVAPMQGTIVKVLVAEGDEVSAGDTVCILEAMKMENQITADKTGKITEVKCQEGDTVGSGDVLVIIE